MPKFEVCLTETITQHYMPVVIEAETQDAAEAAAEEMAVMGDLDEGKSSSSFKAETTEKVDV